MRAECSVFRSFSIRSEIREKRNKEGNKSSLKTEEGGTKETTQN